MYDRQQYKRDRGIPDEDSVAKTLRTPPAPVEPEHRPAVIRELRRLLDERTIYDDQRARVLARIAELERPAQKDQP